MSNKRAAEDNICSFFLDRKKRHCRMKTSEGMNYCPHHSHLGSDQDLPRGLRIPCPLDSSHFCYESKLQKHLRKCNAREKVKPAYYIENINTEMDSNSEISKLSLSDVSDEVLLALIHKVKALYSELNPEITPIASLHPLLKSEMENSTDQLNTFKHMKQQAALLSVMEQKDLLTEGSCFIEFGAGKGQLMYWIIKCTPQAEKKSFILIDRSAQRHKSDNKFKDTNIQIERLRIDIQHVFLGKIESIQNNLHRVVGVTKHLCGAATDLAIRCTTNTLKSEKDYLQYKPLGLLMALCCHHRCNWTSYVGRDFLKQRDITEENFKLMCSISSWATCGLRKYSSDEKEENSNTEHTETMVNENLLNRYQKLNLSHEDREEIGLQCKRLIDLGRLHYLQNSGYSASLMAYTDKSVSLENVALLAVSNKK